MTQPPPYFERVRRKATERWDQLERDSELAAPWHQLFRQVQSPRHVLSELIQNADDAGATEASVRIEEGAFVFEHNGKDFTEEQFESLCRFGFSNKRHLHTIGFRGIGFRSVFSLGDAVEVYSPTLAVRFHRSRFTEPQWLEDGISGDGRTLIRVPLRDELVREELEERIRTWIDAPLSLLFLRNVRRLRIEGSDLRWSSDGPGPTANSEWLTLHGTRTRVLLIRSEEEPFPQEALDELREERLLREAEELASFPPCRVEIALGADGGLFAVLPTGVEPQLPFACNGPFVQDPGRTGIKDPEVSPTNRWLLRRIGRLAAETMLAWLQRAELPEEERARAYSLLPSTARTRSGTLAGSCAVAVRAAFDERIRGEPYVLTTEGELARAGEAIAVPAPLLDVWSGPQVAAMFARAGTPVASKHIGREAAAELAQRRAVRTYSVEDFVERVRYTSPPRPDSLAQVVQLWAFLWEPIRRWWLPQPKELRIVPVEGREALLAAEQVLRLDRSGSLGSSDEHAFLSKLVNIMDRELGQYLGRDAPAGDAQADIDEDTRRRARDVLEHLGLDEPTDRAKAIDLAAQTLFAGSVVDHTSAVALAQLAAKWGVRVGKSFRYITRSGAVRNPEEVLYDPDGTVEDLLPPAAREVLLSDDYSAELFCSAPEWREWLRSGKAGVRRFPLPSNEKRWVYGRQFIEEELARRGISGNLEYRYVTHDFVIEDYDWREEYWRYWEEREGEQPAIWAAILDLVAEEIAAGDAVLSARAFQVSTSRRERPVVSERIPARWILRLREKPCLRDTEGFCRLPAALLRRTPQTEPFIGIEPFVERTMDSEKTADLLDLLGVSTQPPSPEWLIVRLEALAKAQRPPAAELEKLYRRLDDLVATCSREDLERVRERFRTGKLIYSTSGTWETARGVFLELGEGDPPEVPLVWERVRGLTLWTKVGVETRPTVEHIVAWVRSLPVGGRLPDPDEKRLRATLRRFPAAVWEQVGCWLSLSGEWVPLEQLRYAATDSAAFPYDRLFEPVRRQVADLRMLGSAVSASPPFSEVPRLTDALEERLADQPGVREEAARTPAWLTAFGETLARVRFAEEVETARVRGLARELAGTRVRIVSGLRVIPYLDGNPAGDPREADTFWDGRTLSVQDLPRAKMARCVPAALAQRFGRPDIREALFYSYERDPALVRTYLEENFDLEPLDDRSLPGGREPEEGREGALPVPVQVAAPSRSRADALTTAIPASEFDQGDEASEDGEPVSRRRQRRLPRAAGDAKTLLIERYANALGFLSDGSGGFVRPDGATLHRTNGERFPWVLRPGDGGPARYLWPEAACLEREPLELEYDVWLLLRERPGDYSLVVEGADGEPLELTGQKLADMINKEGTFQVFPASVRLVRSDDSHR
ncbi:MAG: hypothetical protein KatS3mg107_0499 [Gemmataceae bacterium]|nr:MAG: hypothetical protein KatS3mg107_0499 [Gemmataceae bacterium]